MDRRRALVFAALLGAPLAVVAVACSFPDVTFTASDSGVGPEGSTSGNPDAPNPNDEDGGIIDAAPIPEAAAPRTDAEKPIEDASVCRFRKPCDCDEDGYLDEACAADAGGAGFDPALVNYDGGRGDCDDLDPIRHPDAGFRPDPPTAGMQPAGDWDCTRSVERLPVAELTCPEPDPPGLGGVLGGSWTCKGGNQGFGGTPSCGVSAPIFACPTGTAGTREGCKNPRPTNVTTVAQCK